MPEMTLEDLLRSSIEGVNREFEEADRALHDEVTSAGQALGKISGGDLLLRLDLAAEDQDNIVYRFFVNSKRSGGANLGAFLVGLKGFPIFFGEDVESVQRAVRSGLVAGKIANHAELRAFFHKMASNPDSPLVQKVAYLMRKKPS